MEIEKVEGMGDSSPHSIITVAVNGSKEWKVKLFREFKVYDCSGDDQIGNCDQSKGAPRDIACGQIHPSKDDQSVGCYKEDKEIVRNKDCGSRKKCKGGKSSEAPAINDSAARKSKKETKRGRKKDATGEVPKDQSGSLPDVGALCI